MGEQIDELVRALLIQPSGAPHPQLQSQTITNEIHSLVSAASNNIAQVQPAADLGLRIDELRRAVVSQAEVVGQNTEAVRESRSGFPSGASSGIVSTVAKTIASTATLGLGPVAPVVTGLFKLFGRNKENVETPLTPFALPEAVKIDAALTANRSIGQLRYAQNGLPQVIDPASATAAEPKAASAPAQVTVNIQALDSRSFLDRSDDIAKAVKEAMLHAHSLNDVVADV